MLAIPNVSHKSRVSYVVRLRIGKGIGTKCYGLEVILRLAWIKYLENLATMKSRIQITPLSSPSDSASAFELFVELGRSMRALSVTLRFTDLASLLDVLYKIGFRDSTLAPLRSSMRHGKTFFCPPCELSSEDLQKLGIPFRVGDE